MNGTLRTPKSVQEIKDAVDKGLDVFHNQANYRVIKDHVGQYLINCTTNGSCIGLTWRDNVTLNGKLEEFIIVELEAS